MTLVKFKENIKLTNTEFENFSDFIENFVQNNFPDSNIDNEYLVASNMKNAWLPDSFIKNFVKSYE